ncbi:MAG: hypothetical protein R2911_17820 [Caldilineaceae bacterium]
MNHWIWKRTQLISIGVIALLVVMAILVNTTALRQQTHAVFWH